MTAVGTRTSVRWWAFASLVVLVVNDRWAKAHFHNTVTGKVSDVAGLIAFPLLVVLAIELLGGARRRSPGLGRRDVVFVVAGVGVGFVLVKLLPSAAWLHERMSGSAEWVLRLPVELIAHGRIPTFEAGAVVHDPTDLWCLVALIVPLLVLRRVLGEASEHGQEGVSAMAGWSPARRPSAPSCPRVGAEGP